MITKKYILVNEIARLNNVKISNFSPLGNDDMLIESGAVIKSGATMLIDKTSNVLPLYIKGFATKDLDYTDLSGLVMVSQLREEFYLTAVQIERMSEEIITIEGKRFSKLKEGFVDIFKRENCIIYPVSKNEIEDIGLADIVKNKQFKQIDKNTFLTWY
jgi:hypothetical protein